MLKLKYLFENFELAKQALMHWEHEEESLDKYLKFFRISSNAIYPFRGYGKRCFLRLSPMEEKQEKNLRGELEFLRYLQSKEYSAMVPILSKEGNLLLLLETEWGNYYASVFDGVPGMPIEETNYGAEIMISYGKALGRLHRISMDYEPTTPKWTYKEVHCWIREVLKEYNAPLSMLEEADEVERELSLLQVTKANFGLVHYDFEPDNVFYDEESDSCFVIDFEDGMYHFFVLDIEQTFDALAEELSRDELSYAKECFLQGYKSEKALEPEYEEQLPLMRRFCNLYSYARYIRCIAEEVPEEPEWMCNLRGKLERKIKFLESIIEANCRGGQI